MQRMPSDQPRLTIGMPVYNGERFLAAAIGSLLTQSFTDFEIVLCDNASTDGTWQIASRFASVDPRLRLLRHDTNLGAAANYNRTVREARGALFKWAAHDDVLLPGFLQACVDCLDARPDVVLCHTLSDAIDAQGRRIGHYRDEVGAEDAATWRRMATMMRAPHYCIPVFGVMRRAVLLQTAMHGDWVGADRNLLAELALRGKIHLVDQVLFLRRHHEGSSITALRDERERLAWFDPAHAGQRSYPTWRRLAEYLHAIDRAPLSLGQRLRCRLQLAAWLAGRHHAGRRNAALMVSELLPRRAAPARRPDAAGG